MLRVLILLFRKKTRTPVIAILERPQKEVTESSLAISYVQTIF